MAADMPEVDRVAASRAAVAARRERAALKDALRSGELSHQDVLVMAKRPEDGVAAATSTLRVTDFLLTLPSVGEAKLGRILDELSISRCKRLGGLGEVQARTLWDFLGEWVDHHPVRERGN